MARDNVRLASVKANQLDRITLAILIPVAVIALLVLAGFAVRKLGEALYVDSDRYRIARLDIKPGKTINRELIREWTRLEEGKPLFGFDAGELRESVLKGAANIKSMSISRRLPDTVHIEVVERDPVARFGSSKGLMVADTEGYIFVLPASRFNLPVVTGYRTDNLRPGDVVEGQTLAALELLDACSDPRLSLRVDAIDVGQEGFLVLQVPQDKLVKEIKMAWKGMGSATADAHQNLLKKLSWLAQVLQSPDVKRLAKLDATLDGGRVYGQ